MQAFYDWCTGLFKWSLPFHWFQGIFGAIVGVLALVIVVSVSCAITKRRRQ